MKLRVIAASSLYLLAVLAASGAATADPSASSATTSNNGVSTGVGNAGSFGIGSGTANGTGTADATATSNGVQDSNNTSASDYHGININAGSVTLSTASMSQAVSGIPASAGYNVPNDWHTGAVEGASNSGSNGINTNVANTGVTANVGVVTSVTAGAISSPLK